MNFHLKIFVLFMIFGIFMEHGDLNESVNLRSFGLKPKPNPKTQMLYKLILEKKRQTNKERESRRKKEQEEKKRNVPSGVTW